MSVTVNMPQDQTPAGVWVQPKDLENSPVFINIQSTPPVFCIGWSRDQAGEPNAPIAVHFKGDQIIIQYETKGGVMATKHIDHLVFHQEFRAFLDSLKRHAESCL